MDTTGSIVARGSHFSHCGLGIKSFIETERGNGGVRGYASCCSNSLCRKGLINGFVHQGKAFLEKGPDLRIVLFVCRLGWAGHDKVNINELDNL